MKNSKLFYYDNMIDFLKEKRFNKRKVEEAERQKCSRGIKKNNTISKIIYGVFCSMLLVAVLIGAFGITSLAIKFVSFFQNFGAECWRNFQSLKNVDRFLATIHWWVSIFTYAISAIPILGAVYGAAKAMNVGSNLLEYINDLLEKIKLSIQKTFDKKNSKLQQKIESIDKRIEEIDTITDNLDKCVDCYKYLVHSSLKDKLFDEKQVNMLDKFVDEYDINTLIFLLYYDKLIDFKKMHQYNRRKIIWSLEVDNMIDKVKRHSIELEQKNANSDVLQRRRRTVYFHTHPYDDMIRECVTEMEDRTSGIRK